MNIVLLGNFRVDYTSESHHAASLESLGHQVIRLQETEVDVDEVLSLTKDADLLVWIHTHGWNTPDIERLAFARCSIITYHLDLWLGLNRQKDMLADPYWTSLDHFFTVDPQMATWLNENTTIKGHYLPAGVYDKECYCAEPDLPFDVAFVGSRSYHPEWPYRTLLVDFLASTYGNDFRHFGFDGLQVVRGQGLNQVYADARVVVGDTLCLNYNYPGYWSDRVYETLGRGGFLIHPRVPGLEEHFKHGEHLVFYDYGDFGQLKEYIDGALEAPLHRQVIAHSGHELVKANHTYVNRWKTILETVFE